MAKNDALKQLKYGVFRVTKTAGEDATTLDFMWMRDDLAKAVADAMELAEKENQPSVCTVLPVFRRTERK